MPPADAAVNRTAWDVTSGPGLTALGLAASRLVESSRPDRLIEDRLGELFLAAVHSPIPFPTAWPASNGQVSDQQALHLHGSRYIGLRTRFYDDVVRRAAKAGVRQVVLLAAGLDTRAVRLGLPRAVRLFELDQPAVLAFKDDVLRSQGVSETCTRVSIGIDLRHEWPAALRNHGFDPAVRTAWVAEGLLAYLPPEAERMLLARISELSADGSQLAADRLVGADRGALQRLSERSGLDMSSFIDTSARQHPPAVLAELGWSVAEESVAEVADRYGRDLSDPFATGTASVTGAAPPWLETVFLRAELGSPTSPRD